MTGEDTSARPIAAAATTAAIGRASSLSPRAIFERLTTSTPGGEPGLLEGALTLEEEDRVEQHGESGRSA